MTPNVPQVKAQAEVIFFDAAGTLIHLIHPVGWHYAKVARHHGLTVKAEALEGAFRAVWKRQGTRAASAGPREDDDRPWWRTMAIETLEAAANPPPSFDRNGWFEELYEHFAQPRVWALYEDAERCLKRLQGRRLAVISNFDGRLRRILGDLGVAEVFEAMVISSEVGCEKPDGGIFRRALEVMGARAEDCLHVGDDPARDWAGAEEAGLRVFRVERPAITLEGL